MEVRYPPGPLTVSERAQCADVAAFCRAWHQHMETWWASHCLDYFVEHEPDRAWELIRALVPSAPDWSQLTVLGGVLANLFEFHGDRFLPVALEEARRSARLRFALEAIDTSDCNHDELPEEILRSLRAFFGESGAA